VQDSVVIEVNYWEAQVEISPDQFTEFQVICIELAFFQVRTDIRVM